MVGSEPISNAEKAGKPLSANNLAAARRIGGGSGAAGAGCGLFRRLAVCVVLGVAALAVLWEWMTLVVGPNRIGCWCCRAPAAIAVADFLAWLGRPVTALFMVGLGALAGAIFAPSERRLWVIAGTGYAGGMVLGSGIFTGGRRLRICGDRAALCDRLDDRCSRLFCRTGFRWTETVARRKPEENLVRRNCGHGRRMIAVALFVAAQFGSFDSIAIIAVALLLSVWPRLVTCLNPG